MILLLIQDIANSGKWLRMPVNIKEPKNWLRFMLELKALDPANILSYAHWFA